MAALGGIGGVIAAPVFLAVLKPLRGAAIPAAVSGVITQGIYILVVLWRKQRDKEQQEASLPLPPAQASETLGTSMAASLFSRLTRG